MKKSLGILKFIIISLLFICGCSKEGNKDVVGNDPPPLPSNKPPTANGGPNHFIYVPRDSVSIDARLSRDIDGNIVSYNLTQISGPAPSMIENHPTQISFHRVKKLIAGSYEFELKVIDDKGASAIDYIRVDVIQGPPSGTEFFIDSLVWIPDVDGDRHTLQTPVRPDIFPNNWSLRDSVHFPADTYLRYDTATSWVQLFPHEANNYHDYRFLSIHGTIAFVYDVSQRNLMYRKASLRIKFH